MAAAKDKAAGGMASGGKSSGSKSSGGKSSGGKAGGPGGKTSRGSGLWLQGMVCGATLTFATPTAMLIGVLLAPGVVALVLEGGAARPISRAVLLSGATFVFAPEWHLVGAGHNMAAALALLQDPAVLLPAWLAGAVGWALCELLPVAYQAMGEVRARGRLAALAAEEKTLREAWDL